MLCPYAVHHAVLIVFIDCLASRTCKNIVLAEDDVDLWNCTTVDLMSDYEDGIGPNSDRMLPVTYSSEAPNRHFTVLYDFGLLMSFPFFVWAGLLRFEHSFVFVLIKLFL